MQAVVTIVRHGETDYNVQKIIQGHLDIPLNGEGVAQAKVLARYLAANVKFDEAYASDLSRARVTAEKIVEMQDGLSLSLDERIRERNLGELQGRRATSQDRKDFAHTMEPNKVLSTRLFSFWDDLFPPLAPLSSTSTPPSEPRQILIVSHGAAIRCFVTSLLTERNDTYTLTTDEQQMKNLIEGRLGNCSITRIVVEKRHANSPWTGRVELYADVTHFEESSRVPSPSENADIVE